MATAITPTGVTFSDSTTQITAGTARNQQALIIGGSSTNNSASPYVYTYTTTVNNVNNAGVVQSDTSYTGTARLWARCAGFGYTQSVHFGGFNGATVVNTTNMISANGTIGSDTTSLGTARYCHVGLSYGGDKGMFALGSSGSGGTGYQGTNNLVSSNLVSNTGVVQSDSVGVVQSSNSFRVDAAACSYGIDKAVILFGTTAGYGTYGSNIADMDSKALVSNTGVIAAYTYTGFTGRVQHCAAGYGADKGFTFGGGYYSGRYSNTFNLIDNLGVVGSSQTYVGATSRNSAYAATIGLQGIIFGGQAPGILSSALIVSKTGSITADIATVATGRESGAAASYG